MNRYRKIILLSLKIGIGSSLSLYTAQELGLNYAVSAGTVTLLSLMNSKWETIRLSGSRIASFLFNNSTCRMDLIYQYKQYVDSLWNIADIYSVYGRSA